ncbi:hypothetical protein Goshw_026940 [Gossypium schwendimanii]|uniref:Isopenicillin N synthase-like Fe(2+) 2OG dioxygenase domain-containing protein n=1 Tax=Gossypium schwendimanii TaxID=34291 RepID=A0A7J9N6M8_GOSSC|nr:hypothetical protein [Gossypium schwendimanii]
MELHKITIYLIKRIAKNLGIDPKMLSSFFEDGAQVIRMNYYPPCVEASKVLGASPLQVNEVEGLQIKKDEKWVSVKPIPGALIVDIGDIIKEKERLSMAAFHNSKVGTKIGPLADLVLGF